MNLADLKAPFPVQELDWRILKKAKNGDKALVVAFLNARAVMDRLDDVVGPENWKCAYVPGPKGGVVCQLGIRIDGEWITKEDGADNTDVEPVKGGISDALKRAAVNWGIGRYLYELPNYWVPLNNEYGDFNPPLDKLPAWARPASGESRRIVTTPEPEDHHGPVYSEAPEPEGRPAPAPASQPQGDVPGPDEAEERDRLETEWGVVKAAMDKGEVDRLQVAEFLKGENRETVKLAFASWMGKHAGRTGSVLVAQVKSHARKQPAGAAR